MQAPPLCWHTTRENAKGDAAFAQLGWARAMLELFPPAKGGSIACLLLYLCFTASVCQKREFARVFVQANRSSGEAGNTDQSPKSEAWFSCAYFSSLLNPFLLGKPMQQRRRDASKSLEKPGGCARKQNCFPGRLCQQENKIVFLRHNRQVKQTVWILQPEQSRRRYCCPATPTRPRPRRIRCSL